MTRDVIDPAHDIRAFCAREIAPFAEAWDRAETLPAAIVASLAALGWIVPTLPAAEGGLGWSDATHAALLEAIGGACQSLRNFVTVQAMVAHALRRWAPETLGAIWPARIARGEAVAAFALTEPGGGSDARTMTTNAEPLADGAFRLQGRKSWISFATRADIVLVFGRCGESVAALLVKAGTPGMEIAPQRGLLGLRASHCGTITFEHCIVPAGALVARGPFVFDTVATGALDIGRFGTACGCVGLAQACLDATVASARGSHALGRHQAVRLAIGDMVARIRAARLLCLRAAALRDAGDPTAIVATLEAKYLAATTAAAVAGDAVRLAGAEGCAAGHPAQRFYRDAKVCEIIEGTRDVLADEIARAYRPGLAAESLGG